MTWLRCCYGSGVLVGGGFALSVTCFTSSFVALQHAAAPADLCCKGTVEQLSHDRKDDKQRQSIWVRLLQSCTAEDRQTAACLACISVQVVGHRQKGEVYSE